MGSKNQAGIRGVLSRWRARDRWRRGAEAFATLLAVAVGAVLALAVLERLVDPSLTLRSASGGLAAAVVLGVALGALLHFFRTPGDLDVAWEIERDQGGRLEARLATAVEFFDSTPPGVAPALVTACAEQSLAQLRDRPVGRSVPFDRFRRMAYTAAICCVGLGIVCHGDLRAMLQLVSRFAGPALGIEIPSPVRFEVTPGDVRLLAGSRFSPRCALVGEVPGVLRAVLLRPDEAPVGYRVPAEADDTGARQVGFGVVHESFDYRFEIGAYRSATYRVRVVEPPRPTDVHLRFVFPAHTGLPPRDQRGGELDVVAPRGTRVAIRAACPRALTAAAIEISPRGGEVRRIPGEMTPGGAGFTATLPVEARGTWRILLTDSDGFEDPTPPRHRLVAEPDSPPKVYILEPGRDREAVPGPGPVVPVKLHATDEFGIRSLRLEYVLRTRRAFVDQETRGEVEVEVGAAATSVTTHTRLDLSGFELVPGDVVSYRALARDTRPGDPEAGTSGSHRYRVAVPFPRDEHAELTAAEGKQEAGLEALAEEQKDWEKRLDRTLRDASADGEITWKERRELEALLEEQKAIRTKAQDMAAQMQETLDEASRAGILEPELEEKMQQVQELLRELADEKMHERLRELRELTSQVKVDPGEIKKQRQRYDKDAHSKSLERMLEALKKLKAKQEIEKIKAEVSALVADQEKLEKETARREAAGEDVAPLALEQAALERRAEAVTEELAELAETMDEEAGEEAKKGVEDARDAMSKGDSALDEMKQSGRRLGQEKAGQAQNHQRRAARKMRQAESALQEAAGGLQAQQAAVNLRQVVKMVRLGLDVSHRQEAVVADAFDDSKDPRQMCRPLASRQDTLYRGIHRFEGHFEESLPDELETKERFATAVSELVGNFLDSKNAFEQVRPFTGRQLAKTAMVKLNQVLATLLDIQEELQNSMSSAGMDQMMERLERMAKQQEMLNKDTQRLQQKEGDAQRKREMAREMSEDQGQLRSELEKLKAEAGKHKETAGMGEKLDQLGKDMDEVAAALEQMSVTQTTRDRQKRIVTRMLDMAASIQKQGESKKREAERAGRFRAPPSPPSPPDLVETRRRFFENQEREGAPLEDRDAVDAYLDLLADEDEGVGFEDIEVPTPEIDIDLEALGGKKSP